MSRDTELPDFRGFSLQDMREAPKELVKKSIQTILRQVERPRANLGGAGPPGRAD